MSRIFGLYNNKKSVKDIQESCLRGINKSAFGHLMQRQKYATIIELCINKKYLMTHRNGFVPSRPSIQHVVQCVFLSFWRLMVVIAFWCDGSLVFGVFDSFFYPLLIQCQLTHTVKAKCWKQSFFLQIVNSSFSHDCARAPLFFSRISL